MPFYWQGMEESPNAPPDLCFLEKFSAGSSKNAFIAPFSGPFLMTEALRYPSSNMPSDAFSSPLRRWP